MKIKKSIDIENTKAYMFADLIIVFIGLSIIILPLLASGSEMPNEFIFGATLASFLLALSVGLLITERMGMHRFVFYGICFILGILSIIYVPVIFTMYAALLLVVEPISSTLTLSALGFLLMVDGFRSYDHKIKMQKKNTLENLNAIKQEVLEHGKTVGDHKKETSEFENKLKENSDNIQNVLKELLAENEKLKAELADKNK